MKYLTLLLALVLPLTGQTLTNTNLDGVTNATINGKLDDDASATRTALGLGTAATTDALAYDAAPLTNVGMRPLDGGESPFADSAAYNVIAAAGVTDEPAKMHYHRSIQLIKGLGLWSGLENAYLIGAAWQNDSTSLKSFTAANLATGTSTFSTYGATFNGTSDTYTVSNATNSGTALTGKTFVAIYKCTRTASAGNALISNYQGGAARGPLLSVGDNPVSGATNLTVINGIMTVDGATATNTTLTGGNDSKYSFAGMSLKDGMLTTYANGQTASYGTLATAWVNNANYRIGSNPNNTYYHQGDIVFAAIFNTGLTPGQMQALRAGMENILSNVVNFSGSVVFEGNSLTAAATGGGTTWPAKLLASTGWTTVTRTENIARSGALQTTEVENRYFTRARQWSPQANQDSIFFLWSGCNDITASKSSTAIINSLRRSIIRARQDGFRVVVLTITPVAASGGGYVWGGTQQTTRTTVNTWIKGEGKQIASQVIDLDEIGVANPDFLTPTLTTYYTDGLHQNDAGRALIAAKVLAEVSPPAVP